MVAGAMVSGTLDVRVTGPNGEPIKGQLIITLIKMGGEVMDQTTTSKGTATFNVTQNEYTVSVISRAYRSVTKKVQISDNRSSKLAIELEPITDAEEASSNANFYALSPRVQKDVGRALDALHANKPNDAYRPLLAAEKKAPANAEIEYIFGIYSSQVKNEDEAMAHWKKALEINPKHLSTLLAIGDDLLQQKKSADALPYLNRAAEAEPSSWRAHALLAEALLLQRSFDDAISHAQRAIDLGHERAAAVQPVLMRAETARGQEPQMHGALRVLQEYVQAHPDDAAAARDLEKMKKEGMGEAPSDPEAAARELAALKDATALPVPSKWLPPDVDEKIPPVEAGAACAVDDVVQKAGVRLKELVTDVDRFTATESLTHESIDKFGLPSQPEKRKFDYLVSIQLLQGRYLNVEEYRSSPNGAAAEFPGGVVTNGLPSLVLIFHPVNAPNFTMTCEGLAHLSSGPAWQIHFRQRDDKPNTIKRYRIGADGPSYPVALKGRAWIAADTYQIVRLETDLVSPVPQIKLVADHSDIEYGPVKFKDGKVSMWLPQSAEVYYDWRGRRIHRRHSFSQYLLFAVDDRQKISAPKDDAAAEAAPTDQTIKPH